MKISTQKLAESLSQALNPFLLLPVIFLIALFETQFPSQSSLFRWLGVILISNFLIPILFILYLKQRGIILDDTLSNKTLHRRRLIAMLPIDIILSLEIITMLANHIYQPLFVVFLSSFIITIIGGIISYFWKISAHALGLSTSITLLYLLFGPWALLGTLAIPVIAWSRLILHRHTPLQFWSGIILPPLIIIGVFSLFKY